ncbi:hypothetical protein D9758_007430 [Tetrapyrgos nigripes]|uniref:Uncharacterized protein n=1 Tax=Tetrapyrgos nigripes TaxID=182062 RepID=A0A8H5LHT2_9AGAR|nr:hypothetical protein D9758_007430 [Tetrapyrgos nigripes]
MLQQASTLGTQFRNILFLFTFAAVLIFLSSTHLKSLDLYYKYIDEQTLTSEQQLHEPSSNSPRPEFAQFPPNSSPSNDLDLDLEIQKYSPYCPSDRCGQGRWVPRVPRFETVEEVQKAINIESNKNGQDLGVRLPDPEPEPFASVHAQEKKENLLRTSNWVWESDFGELVPFDIEEFVIRLLKSPGGLFLIGDSLTSHHFWTVLGRILRAGIRMQTNTGEWPMKDQPYITQYSLDMSLPTCQELVRKAGIPLLRAKRPIITFILLQHLVSQKEFNQLFRAERGYVHDQIFAYVEGWQDFVAEMTKKREGEFENGVNEDSLVVINSGAHWSRSKLKGYILENDEEGMRRRVEHAYFEMIKLTLANLSPLSHSTVFIRSITPGHPSCGQYPSPFFSIEEANEWNSTPGNNEPLLKEYDWDAFGPRNEMWRNEIERYEQERNRDDKDGVWNGKGAKWVYLDFWEMDLQRIDAHFGHWDCLHYTIPFQQNQWTDMLFHRLVVEKHLKDRH